MKEKGSRAKNQPSLDNFAQKTNHQGISDLPLESIPREEPIADDTDPDRRKRRKTTPPAPQDFTIQDVQSIATLSWRQQLQVVAGLDVDQDTDKSLEYQEGADQSTMADSTETIEQLFPTPVPSMEALPANPAEPILDTSKKTPPKRILKMTNGKLVSPSSPKASSASSSSKKESPQR